ncbi:MFS transporter [Streptomyces thermolineatus]|uniref:MFS transporter n=1 Tax=Streptomyces thermolineatus TaxID=44033 RepID=UPI0031E3DC1B
MLSTPGAWRFLVPGFAARLPYAMLGLGIVLLLEHTTGSYGTAGAVAAAAAIAQALAGPHVGRLADRRGQAAVVVPASVAHALSVSALTALALTGAPLWALFAAALAAGGTTPQIGPMIRSRWMTRLGPSPLTGTAFAFESVTDEFTFVVGPVVTTALCTAVHPAAGLAATAALVLAGGLLFAAQRTGAPAATGRARPGTRHAGAMSAPGLRLLVVAFLGIGTVFGSLQVSLAAFARETGTPGLAGWLYAVFAGGSMAAGVLYGAVRRRSALDRQLLVTYALLVLAAAPLWTARSPLPLGAVALLCGLAVAPTLITGFTLAEVVVPDNAKTEAFTWLTGAVGLGLAAGSTVAGQLADLVGARAGLAVPAVGTGCAFVLLLLARRLLRPTPRP